MRFHTRLGTDSVYEALGHVQDRGLVAAGVRFAVFTLQPSRTHDRSFEIQLGTYDQNSLPGDYLDQHGRHLRVRRARNARDGGPRWAATWHEWGWLIAELFEADPGSRWGDNPARSGHPHGYFSPEDFHAKTGGAFRTAEPEATTPEVIIMPETTALRAYREDGTEVQPGDTVTQFTAEYTFPDSLEDEFPDDGKITVRTLDGAVINNLYAGPFGLTVRAVPGRPGVLAWESAGTVEPRDISRDIRGPGGFWALVGPASDGRWEWSVIDSSDGATVFSGTPAGTREEAQRLVADWEQANIPSVPEAGIPLLPHVTPPPPVHDLASTLPPGPSDRSELDGIIERVNQAQYGSDFDADEELAALRRLAHVVRAQLKPGPGAAALAAEAERAAQRMAPPVPGVTRNAGCVVYSVLEAGTRDWYVAAIRESDGARITWRAEAASDGTLVYSGGNYHTRGQGSADETLVDLANRAGVFGKLTGLSSGAAARESFQESHAKVLEELSAYGVGKAKIRAGLLEAAALGYARISWHSGRVRNDYGIHYDRVSCIFTWYREN